ncbi:hypothetical protein [Actinocorallia longicatena]|uniref:Uncharacterized protein n=1 Tax=Actinocorallia longicatena TaxID=111803 RepID=A0ABP6QGX9_9ACTN
MLLWIELDQRGELTTMRRAWVDAGDVAAIAGQNYRAVPRLPPAAGELRDETDPRDPGRMSRAEARRRIDGRMERREEPDF